MTTTARRSLILVAAGGLARETLAAVRAADAYDPIGFIDDDPARHGTTVDGLPVLGGLAAVADHPDAAVVLCAGRGSARAALADRLGLPSSRYATVVHPSVSVPASCRIGPGCIVLAQCSLTTDVQLGAHVVAMPGSVFTHDDVLANCVTVAAGVSLGGGVHVGAGAYIGMNASVRENSVLGADVTVGMGAVVLGDVPAGETWVGVPARPMSKNSNAQEVVAV